MTSSVASTWDRVSLGDIGEALIGLTYEPQSVKQAGTLVLRSSNIQDGRLAFEDNVYVDCPIPNRIRVRDCDILICVRNGSRRLIGKSTMLDCRVVGQTFGAFMAVFRSDANPYLRYFFQSDDFKRQIDAHLGATINQITNGSLKSFTVLMPGKKERARIAERLSDFDDLVATLEWLIAKKQAIKRGMMQQLLTGRTRLPGFTRPWLHTRLGDVLKVRHGRSQKDVETEGGRFPILATGGEIGRTNVPLYSKPSVLIGRKGTIDRPQFQSEPFWTVDTLFYTEVSVKADPKFLFYVFTTIDWRSMNEASGVPSLSSGRVEGVSVRLPTIDEQIAISTVLDDAQSEIDVLHDRHVKARAMKQGMMQELLSGRTRLPVAEAAT